MLLHALKLHPGSSCDAVSNIEVVVGRTGRGNLALNFSVVGNIDGILLPQAAKPERIDELWRHTCFEAFVRPGVGLRYCEFNFSPSRQWAAYRFSAYREGMTPITELGAMPGKSWVVADRLMNGFVVDLEHLPEFGPGERGMLGLSAVIEEINGNKSYWALAHPQGKPDFHHADSFALELPPPEQT